jgi:predicted dehydrogenase
MVHKLRLGVIGTGAVFESMHLPALKLVADKFEVVALCNHNIQKAEKFKNTFQSNGIEIYSDYLELLKEESIDVVLISVPIHLNASIAIDAISSGKHVFLEKPLADNLDQADKLMGLSKLNNRKLFVGEIIRYRPQYKQAHDLINTGIIGTPKLYRINDLHFTYPGGIYDTEWRKESPQFGGYVIDGGPHIIAGMREVIQSEVISIHGQSLSFHPELFSDQPETLLMDLEFKNGLIGQLCIGCGTIDRDARRPKMYGTEGTLVIEKDHIHVWFVGKGKEDTVVKFERAENEFLMEWLDFYNEIILDQTPYNSLQKTYEDILILLKCLQSARENRIIRL